MKKEGYQEFEGHVYLDITNPFVAWNVSRGGFCSSNVLHFNGGFSENSIPLSPWSESLFRQGNELKLEVEFRLEALRKKEFPEAVSRLAGIFVFGCVEDVAAFWASEGWGSHFEDANLADCGVQAHVVSRLDANWIPVMIDGDGKLASDWQTKARQYWNGDCVPGQVPIWETLVSGGITIWSTDLKDKGLAEIKRSFPEVKTARYYSEMAFDVGSLDGIAAFVAVVIEDHLEIECRFRFVDGQDMSFRRDLSRGIEGQSGTIHRFPENRNFSFPAIKNRVYSGSSYSFNLKQFIHDLGLISHLGLEGRNW